MRELSMDELEQVVGGQTLTWEDIKDNYLRNAAGVPGVQEIINGVEINCTVGIKGECTVRVKATGETHSFSDVDSALCWVLYTFT